MEKKAPIVKCPQCGGQSIFAPSNPFRPFCSDRCKKIDFGAWASESFKVAGSQAEPEDLLEVMQNLPSTKLH